jgi:hypothetical protein
MWQQRLFVISGLLAAVLLGTTAVRLVAGLSTSERPTSRGAFAVPAFASLVECNAHFSHEILRIKNSLPAHNNKADLPLMHRNYRRLHRLLRQVGRRDGIPPRQQTNRLRARVSQMRDNPEATGTAMRERKCRAMAELPIARKRHSQRIIGR